MRKWECPIDGCGAENKCDDCADGDTCAACGVYVSFVDARLVKRQLLRLPFYVWIVDEDEVDDNERSSWQSGSLSWSAIRVGTVPAVVAEAYVRDVMLDVAANGDEYVVYIRPVDEIDAWGLLRYVVAVDVSVSFTLSQVRIDENLD